MIDREQPARSKAEPYRGPALLVPLPSWTLVGEMGQGKSGPQDDWRIPTGPVDETKVHAEVVLKTVRWSGAVVLLLDSTATEAGVVLERVHLDGVVGLPRPDRPWRSVH